MTYSSPRNRGSRRSNTVSRRDYLRTAGAAGIGGLSLSMALGRAGAVSPLPHALTIAGDGSYTSYAFTVSGDLEGTGLTSEDSITGSSATGAVGGGRDSYHFSGNITDFSVDGDAIVYLDGEEIDVERFLPHSLAIDGDGSYTSYTFSASGDLAGEGLTAEDSISGSTATGAVSGGRDSYHFSGEITDFSMTGDATVSLDGEVIDPAQLLSHTLVIDGDGSYTSYTFSVSGTLIGEGLTAEDSISDSTATGAVGGGRDSYRFSGEILTFDLDGDAVVYLDDERMNSDRFSQNTLAIAGDGSYTSYTFTVSGDLAGEGLTSEDSITGSSATGAVGGGRDRYTFSGEITDFEMTGDAAVYLNGEQVDHDSLGDDGSTDLKLGYDARARSHQRGRPYESFDEFSKGWYATSGHLSADTEWTFDDDSAASARLDGYADDDRIGMAVDFRNGESFAGRDLSLAVRLGETENETLRVELYAQDASDQYIATRYLSSVDEWVRVDLGPTAIRGSPDLDNVRRFGIECYTGGKRVRMNIDAIRTTERRGSGAVVLTFDDNHRTQYDVAFPEMNRRGMPGTVGVIHDIVGNANRLSLDQMHEMQAAGWTMASHPQGDGPSEGLGRVSHDRAEQMIRETKGWLVDNGFGEGARCLIWPFGDHDHDALELAGEYHELSFGGGSSPCPGVVTEAAWVPRVDADEVNDALDAIDAAARYDQVLVLMVHTIGLGRISTNDFNRLLDRIEVRGLDVLTASDFADEQ